MVADGCVAAASNLMIDESLVSSGRTPNQAECRQWLATRWR